ncbi:gamma-glutamyltransferase family protein [Paenibacillus sp. MWE-103]|uniref:Gamma-glutamyltransferase family protein n=1 Tax=Paenibacillus artemisiicola TaxID=1172618 RepID=A0ABS3WJQ1_9BACL|nr:gamma-glutamyltransferase family protein [Paenibacillus artemisiicola]MBO7748345.1 gamma-glutamyltransferase family protein [Paenibacillus artemisiicola]
MKFDAMHHPYPSKRMTLYGKNGMVATSQSAAAQAGLDMLKKGGNAVDAAVAAAACMIVAEPTSNGLGGDAFAIVYMDGKLHGLNGSGSAPAGISADAVKALGHKRMPAVGWLPVTVPGVPASWAALSERFGKLPFSELLRPAITYAAEGCPVAPDLAREWKRYYDRYAEQLQGEEFEEWFRVYAPEGRAPEAGEVWRSQDHARSLAAIAETGARAFYEGGLADRIDHYSRKQGGFIRKSDLEAYAPQWVDPISVNYRGYDIWELPPNGQGLVPLIALNLLKGFDRSERDLASYYHKQIEAIKLAFADGKAYITDPEHMKISVRELLSDSYAEERRKLIGKEALLPLPGRLPRSDTIYLCAADGDGNMVSFIQSNADGFGSGVVVPGTGIALQNRGSGFSLDPADANCLEPGKKSYHTLIPGFITRNGEAVGPFGVMGGYMQPQGHVQVVSSLADFGFSPQAALDAPRWQWLHGRTVKLERGFAEPAGLSLLRMGHDIQWAVDQYTFGKGQIILRNKEGVLAGATEPRSDGVVAAW